MDRRARVRGSLLLDGAPLDSAQLAGIAYVAQDDTLLPTLTVEESLRYSALLRLRGKPSPADVQVRRHGGCAVARAARDAWHPSPISSASL
jgi:ABC-type multidrug transport system ATPase subunit